MLEFTRQLTLGSAISYTLWRLRHAQDPITVKLRSGQRLELRAEGTAANNDYGVAYEVFAHRFYGNERHRSRKKVELIVDLGANVGYSVLYFLHRYPAARIIAFEPHAEHAAQVKRNLALDGTGGRVTLYNKAAGARNRMMRLSDEKSSSRLMEDSDGPALAVEVVDIFPLLQGKRIDLFKMDIEGGEYEILADDRFAALDIAAVVLEWHSRGNGLADRDWCQERLVALGFTIREIFSESDYGMFWADKTLEAKLGAA